MSAIRSSDLVSLNLALGNRFAAEVLRSANHLLGELVPSRQGGFYRLGNPISETGKRVLQRPLPTL